MLFWRKIITSKYTEHCSRTFVGTTLLHADERDICCALAHRCKIDRIAQDVHFWKYSITIIPVVDAERRKRDVGGLENLRTAIFICKSDFYSSRETNTLSLVVPIIIDLTLRSYGPHVYVMQFREIQGSIMSMCIAAITDWSSFSIVKLMDYSISFADSDVSKFLITIITIGHVGTVQASHLLGRIAMKNPVQRCHWYSLGVWSQSVQKEDIFAKHVRIDHRKFPHRFETCIFLHINKLF